ncbi:hypothetical protein BJY04DRAFT_53846 [Aspergillus karnatakaensis]|uniref:uncharacterized protein n=1 Tax=Aspergillus karnatakaensis TaxID=1810916 RepID=UPI003CCE1E6F
MYIINLIPNILLPILALGSPAAPSINTRQVAIDVNQVRAIENSFNDFCINTANQASTLVSQYQPAADGLNAVSGSVGGLYGSWESASWQLQNACWALRDELSRIVSQYQSMDSADAIAGAFGKK